MKCRPLYYRQDPALAPAGRKPMFGQSIKRRKKSVLYCISPNYLSLIKQIKKSKPRNVENTSLRFVFFSISLVFSNARRVLHILTTRWKHKTSRAVDVLMARAKIICISIIKVNKLFSFFPSWCFIRKETCSPCFQEHS